MHICMYIYIYIYICIHLHYMFTYSCVRRGAHGRLRLDRAREAPGAGLCSHV